MQRDVSENELIQAGHPPAAMHAADRRGAVALLRSAGYHKVADASGVEDELEEDELDAQQDEPVKPVRPKAPRINSSPYASQHTPRATPEQRMEDRLMAMAGYISPSRVRR